MVKNPPASAGNSGDVGSIPGLGRSPAVGNGNPSQDTSWEAWMKQWLLSKGSWGFYMQGPVPVFLPCPLPVACLPAFTQAICLEQFCFPIHISAWGPFSWQHNPCPPSPIPG